MKRFTAILILLTVTIGLTACGKKEPETASENTMTVADEFAEGVSEDVVPIEATMAITLTFDVPQQFRPSKSNTDNNETYVSENVNDNSYICYIRQDKDNLADYKLLTEEDYKKAIEQQLDTEITINSMEQTNYDAYDETILDLTYTRNNVKYEVTEFIFITEKYLFTVVYAMDSNAYWQREFQQSMESIKIENTISLMESEEEPSE